MASVSNRKTEFGLRGFPWGLVGGGGVEARSQDSLERINKLGVPLSFLELILVAKEPI